jgi:type IV secretion system protein VirB2
MAIGKFLNYKVSIKKITAVLLASVFASSLTVFAGGGGLPWEGPLQMIQQSLSGPVAGGVAMIALVVAGSALIFGEDMGGFAKKMVGVVMAGAVLVLGNSMLSSLGLTASGLTLI